MLRLKRPLRPNSNADPDDVLAVKRRLADYGFYEPPTGDFHPWPDAELFAGIEAFQKAAGETPDGEMLPSGPTEAALNRLAAPAKEDRNAQPIAFGKDLLGSEKAISDSETWRDSVARQTGMQPTDAALPLVLAIPPAASALGEAGLALLPGLLGGAALIFGQKALEAYNDSERSSSSVAFDALPSEKPEPFGGPSQEEIDRLNKELGRPLPGRPAVPEARRPQIEQILPPALDPKDWLEVQPDDPGLGWPIFIERRGNEDTRQLNTKYNRCIEDAAEEAGIEIEHEGGGRDREGNEVPEKHYKNRETGGLKGGSFLDGAYRLVKSGRRLLFNTYTARADGMPNSREERQAVRILQNKDTDDLLVLAPKGEFDERSCRKFFKDLLTELDAGAPGDANSGWRTVPKS